MRQVLVNLIGNALKFTENGTVQTRINWVHETEDRSRGTLLIEVEDTGLGISPEKQEEIFKPFVQSEPRRGGENEGSGLGLNIVQRMMELMNGTVTLQSAPGKGSIFRLRFPDVSISARLPVSDLVEAEEVVDFDDFEPATLLVVDDNETNRELIKAMFEKTHHQIQMARDGLEALKSIRESPPAVVLLDVRMPGMDGLQTLAEIRKTPTLELLPIIAVTASTRVNEDPELTAHFNGFLRKPFSQKALYEELGHFLRRAGAAEPSPEGGGNDPEPTMATARRAVEWDQLLAELCVLRAGEWETVSESLAINHTHSFARKLQFLAEQTQCVPLEAYANSLTAYADTYSVHDLERHLSSFPALVQMIEDQTKATRG